MSKCNLNHDFNTDKCPVTKPLHLCETFEEELAAMQGMINSGLAWKMEGTVGRRAMELIRSGHCTLGESGHRDYYGNYVPSRTEVQAGTKGSMEYQQTKMAELARKLQS